MVSIQAYNTVIHIFIVSEQHTGIYLFILFLLNYIDIDGEQNIIESCNSGLSDIL